MKRILSMSLSSIAMCAFVGCNTRNVHDNAANPIKPSDQSLVNEMDADTLASVDEGPLGDLSAYETPAQPDRVGGPLAKAAATATRMGSIKMQDVACNYSSTSGNWAWACGLTNVNNENIYKWDPGKNNWVRVQGIGTCVTIATVSGYTGPWHINSQGMVWRLDPSRGWIRVRIGVEEAGNIASTGNEVYILEGLTHEVKKYNPSTGGFVTIYCPCAGFATDGGGPKNYLYSGQINSEAYLCSPAFGSFSAWFRYNGFKDLGGSASGRLFFVAQSDSKIYRLNFNSDGTGKSETLVSTSTQKAKRLDATPTRIVYVGTDDYAYRLTY
jgi:hypothetical protein